MEHRNNSGEEDDFCLGGEQRDADTGVYLNRDLDIGELWTTFHSIGNC
jgi:hypothetical protein